MGAATAVAACGPTHPAAAHRPAPHRRANGLIGYPSWLPKSTLHFHSDATLVGTVAHPALTDQGDTVIVKTPKWSVHAIVRGPEVPGEGLSYQAPTTTCTWTVTLWDATGPVPIRAADWDSIDHQGDVYHPAFVAGQPKPPATLRRGGRTSFELRTGEAVGEGLMRWAPSGGRIVAKWDFIVEND